MATLDDLVGESRVMVALRLRVQRLLERLSGLRRLPPILIQGETGTGKTLLARLIHRASPRSGGPFVDLNCAAIPETMLESELFGHERFAFTDAKQAKPGLFQTAHGGVLFLDEIGLMPMALQPKLLTALDEGSVRRLGATRNELVDVAIVAATNEDLHAAIREKRFREDLYSRLAVLSLEVPPLRAREGDVELLAERFLARACEDYGIPAKTLGDDARAALRAYAWPENVRELRNVMERVSLEVDAGTVTAESLGLPLAAPTVSIEIESAEHARGRLLEVLRRTNWNISRTGALLGITRKTVRARIQRYGLRPPAEVAEPTSIDASSVAASHSSVVSITDVSVGTSPAVAEVIPAEPLASPVAAMPELVPAVSPAAMRWDRRRVTLLRARIMSDSAIPLAAATRLLDGVVEKVRSFGGRVEDVSARGLVAAFGLEPDEDAPRRAANAGLAILKSVERESGDGALPGGLSIGVAIHVTRQLVADVAGVVAIDGEAKAQAWPILDQLALSSGEGLAVSETAAQFLGRHYEIVRQAERGHVVARLVGRAPTDVKFAPTEFVGRDRELALLQGLLEHASEGRGQLVTIVGDPGIGKSRLVHEFGRGLAPDAVTLLKGQCVSYDSSAPYHLVLDMLRDVCGVQEGDHPEEIDAKARAVLERVGASDASWAPYVLNLLCPWQNALVLGMRPDAVKARTFEALQQLVIAQQERQPLVIVVEDLHWVDRTSEELLSAFADMIPRTRTLLVCTSRPGYHPPWSDRSHASQVALAPLAAEASRELVESLLSGHGVDPTVVEIILSRAEGNPFFLEELARALRDEDAPARMRIPETVHDVLSTRILRLSNMDRGVLQSAAVIGRDFSSALLEALCDMRPEHTRASLSTLQAAEFLYPVRLGADAAYTFSHTLTWDVAYDSMLEDDRMARHARVVDVTERLYSTRLGDHVERLAEHAERGALWDKAIGYARQAGIKAVERSACRDAADHFTRALAALAHIVESPAAQALAIDLRLDLRSALLPLGEFRRMVDVLREAEHLAERLGDARRTARVSAYLTDYFRQVGEHERAAAIGRRALEAANEAGDLSLRVASGIYLGLAYYDLGQYRQGADLLSATIATVGDDLELERFGLPFLPAAHMRTWLSLCLAELGEFDDALAAAREAVRIATKADHPASMASAHVGVGRAYLRRGQVAEAMPDLQRAVEIGRQWNIRILLPMILEALGTAHAVSGRASDALPLLEEALDIHASMRGGAGQSIRWASLSTAHMLAGRATEAMRAAVQALEFADKHGERGHHAYALHALAGASRQSRDIVAASRVYREAITVCEELGMRPLGARCQFGLATLLERSGDQAEAQALHSMARGGYEQMGMLIPPQLR